MKTDFKHISAFSTPEESSGYLLWRMSMSWRSEIEKVLKPLNLTHPQFVVLACLAWLTRSGERVSQIDVGRIAGLDPNGVSQILRGLEAKKFIKRKIGVIDERAKSPLLTDVGKEVLAQAMPAVEKADAQFFSVLSSQESQNLCNLFQKLISE